MERATRRTLTGFSIWLLLVVALAGFAWLSWHPEAAILDVAARWKPMEPVVRAFRARYAWSKGEADAGPGTGGGTQIIVERRYELIGPEPIDAPPRVWLPAGAEIHAAPDVDSPLVHRQQSVAGLPYDERRDDWFHLRTPVFEGWVRLPGYNEVSDPPLGSGQRPPKPLAGRPPALDRLQQGLGAFSDVARRLSWGPYTVYTDVPDASLLEDCRQVASGLGRTYARRYGLTPKGSSGEVILLFHRHADYLSFQSEDAQIAGLPAAGHAGSGFIAVSVEGSSRDEILATLVHEMTHLLNRRALGPALPPWLQEGTADDLGMSARGASGELRFDTFNGWRRRTGGVIEVGGGIAALDFLKKRIAAGELLALKQLLELDWDEFVRSPDRQSHYAESFLFVRYLMAAPDRRRATKRYLHTISEGGSVAGEQLRQALGMDWDALQRDYVAWALSPAVSQPRPR